MAINEVGTTPSRGGRAKFFIGGALIIGAVIYLIVSSARASAEYFKTVEELNAHGDEMVGQAVRVSGAVIGETIKYNPVTFDLQFEIAHIPADNKEINAQGGLAVVLHNAVNNPALPRIKVLYNGVMPDLMRDEAQAILTGRMGADGIFYADELLLKCPTRYEEAVPEQAIDG